MEIGVGVSSNGDTDDVHPVVRGEGDTGVGQEASFVRTDDVTGWG